MAIPAGATLNVNDVPVTVVEGVVTVPVVARVKSENTELVVA